MILEDSLIPLLPDGPKSESRDESPEIVEESASIWANRPIAEDGI